MLKNRENIVIGDYNGHVGLKRTGIENILGAHGIGDRKEEGYNL